MLPGMGADPKQLKKLMQQMGMKSEEIDTKRVVIETENGNIVIEPASVTSIEMHGQKSYQISGKERIEGSGPNTDDIKLVAQQAGVSEEKAAEALKESGGDIAQAILKLKG